MFNNPYNYNPQVSVDRINNQITELEKMKQQIQQPVQPTNLTQNFQLAPSNNLIKFANSMEEVERNIVIGDTPFFSNDMSVVWIKNVKNEIKTYELKEVVPKDEKDLKIEYLQLQIEELKKGMNLDEQSDANVNEPIAEPVESKKSTNVSNARTSKTKSK